MLLFFFFEIRYWLRSIMLWVFTGIVSLVVLLAMSSDQISDAVRYFDTELRQEIS